MRAWCCRGLSGRGHPALSLTARPQTAPAGRLALRGGRARPRRKPVRPTRSPPRSRVPGARHPAGSAAPAPPRTRAAPGSPTRCCRSLPSQPGRQPSLPAFSALSQQLRRALARASHPAARPSPSGVTAAADLTGWVREGGSALRRVPAASKPRAGNAGDEGCRLVLASSALFRGPTWWHPRGRGLRRGAREREAEAEALRRCLLAP